MARAWYYERADSPDEVIAILNKFEYVIISWQVYYDVAEERAVAVIEYHDDSKKRGAPNG